MKNMKTWIAVLLCVLLLTCAAAADETVTQTTDENGNTVTVVTDENGNQMIIEDVDPSSDDITFDEDDADFGDDDAAPGAPAEPEVSAAPAAQAEKGGSALSWLVPLLVAVCACAAVMIVRLVRKKDR